MTNFSFFNTDLISAVKKEIKDISFLGNIYLLTESIDRKLAKSLAAAGHQVSIYKKNEEIPKQNGLLIAIGDESVINTAKLEKANNILLGIPDAPYSECFTAHAFNGANTIHAGHVDRLLVSDSALSKHTILFNALLGVLMDITCDLIINDERHQLKRLRKIAMSKILCFSNPIENLKFLCNCYSALAKESIIGATQTLFAINRKRDGGFSKELLNFYTLYLIYLMLVLFKKHETSRIMKGNDQVHLRETLKTQSNEKTPFKDSLPPAVFTEANTNILELQKISLAFKQRFKEKSGKIPIVFALENILITAHCAGQENILSWLSDCGYISGIMCALKEKSY
ncbi:MAG: hypothetical protein LBU55_00925 [Elusimicrobiota bacterium]|nr:hypothetical protein [Elusimicrobiota bacterium]